MLIQWKMFKLKFAKKITILVIIQNIEARDSQLKKLLSMSYRCPVSQVDWPREVICFLL
jgi:hypothetical protein